MEKCRLSYRVLIIIAQLKNKIKTRNSKADEVILTYIIIEAKNISTYCRLHIEGKCNQTDNLDLERKYLEENFGRSKAIRNFQDTSDKSLTNLLEIFL